ncbi:MAG: hypothetical protein IPG98_16625 [Burkholderiales bacterium]|nr:hypothetical protein [Burkholderiales bacterium]MBK8666787.1 hypothetical protein [Burkholderiales bacterium]
MVWLSDFDPVAGAVGTAHVAGLRCPRCARVGLERIDDAALQATPLADLLVSLETLCPSLAVRCPTCGLAGNDWQFGTDMGA